MAPQNPQAQLQDSNGNIKGIFYVNSNDSFVLHEPQNGNEAILKNDGTFDVSTLQAGSATINGNAALQDGGDTGIAPGFGAWTTADTNRPTLLIVEGTAETDGTSEGKIVLDVDKSGGTTADYTMTVTEVDPALGTGVSRTDESTVYIPPGGQYQIRNVSDPNAVNATGPVREVTQ